MRAALRLERKRLRVQVSTALVSNLYVPGFLYGTIYQGSLKRVCVPFLNCYSCPGALASCPIGAMQFLATSQAFPFYALGATLAAGAVAGRAICGWLCPFGLVQDLLDRLSRVRLGFPSPLRLMKYLILLLLLPAAALWIDSTGLGAPRFCQLICPAGTLQAALPLMAANASLRAMAGALFWWKTMLMAVILGLSVVVYRPFCRALCPLGALHGLMNRLSLLRIWTDRKRCRECGACQTICPVGLDLPRDVNSPECIRCLRCTRSCAEGGLWFGASKQVPARPLAVPPGDL